VPWIGAGPGPARESWQRYSPDLEYISKRDNLYKLMGEAAASPGRIELVFLDEMGYAAGPSRPRDWTGCAPEAPPPG